MLDRRTTLSPCAAAPAENLEPCLSSSLFFSPLSGATVCRPPRSQQESERQPLWQDLLLHRVLSGRMSRVVIRQHDKQVAEEATR